MPAPNERQMNIPLDTVKAIYRRALDPRASAAGGTLSPRPKWAIRRWRQPHAYAAHPGPPCSGPRLTTGCSTRRPPIRPTLACPDHSGAVGTGSFPSPGSLRA